jgi:hypothetical protein
MSAHLMFTIGWVFWLAFFVIWEGAGLYWEFTHDETATFSRNWWDALKTRAAHPGVLTWAGRAVTLIFVVWLYMHLEFGWWTL